MALIRGTRGNDDLHGTDAADQIVGGLGSDYIYAGAGNDLVLGGRGDDYMRGEVGDDTLFGGDDDDVMEGGLGADIVSGDAGDDWLYGTDTLDGDEAFNTLLGGAGDDRLHSYAADLIDGGSGSDLAVINRQNSDVAIRADFTDMERAQVWADGTVIIDVEQVEFRGGGGDDIVGGSNAADLLVGGGGADKLSGAAGIDLINGGTGRDRLIGGEGNDVFYFAFGTGRDRIVDFTQGEDRIGLGVLGGTFEEVLAATTRDAATGLVTINLAQLNGAAGDRIELVTDPAQGFAFTPADFELLI